MKFAGVYVGTLVAEGASMRLTMRGFLERLDRRGSISVEYLLVLVFAGVVVVIAVMPVLGPAIIEEYAIRRTILYSSFP